MDDLEAAIDRWEEPYVRIVITKDEDTSMKTRTKIGGIASALIAVVYALIELWRALSVGTPSAPLIDIVEPTYAETEARSQSENDSREYSDRDASRLPEN